MSGIEGGVCSRSFSWGTGITRCYLEVNTTSYTDSVKISFSGKVRSGNDSGTTNRLSGYGVTCNIYTSAGGSASTSSTYNYANWVANCSTEIVVYRKHESFNVLVTCSYSSYNGASNTGSVSINVGIDPKPSYTISFNANGGTGVPNSLTKWYGEQITIPSTIPTRTNYRFDGWSESSSATTATYKSGNSYWVSEKSTTYYAVWTLLYKSPTVTYSDAHRVDSASSSAESALGEYGYLVFDWTVDTEIYPENALKSIEAIATLSDGSTPTCTITGATGGTSGTIYIHIPIATSLTATVSVTATDTAKDGTGTANGSIGTGHIPFELANGGTAIGLLNSAGDSESITIGNLNLTNIYDSEYHTIPFNNVKFITESSTNQDPNAGWVYNKYSNGFADAWYNLPLNNDYASGGTWGSFYYAQLSSRTYPVSFTDIPIVNFTYQNVSGSTGYAVSNTGASKTGTGTILILGISKSSRFNGYCSVHVCGRYQ